MRTKNGEDEVFKRPPGSERLNSDSDRGEVTTEPDTNILSDRSETAVGATYSSEQSQFNGGVNNENFSEIEKFKLLIRYPKFSQIRNEF